MEQIVNRGGEHPLKSHANINVYLRTSSRFEKSGNAKECGKWESIKNKTVHASTCCVIASMHRGVRGVLSMASFCPYKCLIHDLNYHFKTTI